MTDFSTELTPILFGEQLLAGVGALTLAAAQAATYSIGQPYIQLLGYHAVGDGGGGMYIPASAGAGAGKFQSHDGQWWILTPGVDRWLNAKMFGAYGDGTHDDTAALQAAFNFANAGDVFVPPGTFNYTALTIGVPVRVHGSNVSTSTPASLLACTAATNTDKIVIGNLGSALDGVVIENLAFTAAVATGGAIVSFVQTTNCMMRDFHMHTLFATAIGVKVNQVNVLRLDNFSVLLPTRAGVYVYGDDATRSDIIEINSIVVSGNSTGAATILPAGVELDGYVHTITGEHWYFVTTGRGLWRHNAAGTTLRAQFVEVTDFECDFPYYEAIRIDYGDTMFFENLYVQGSVTANNIYVAHNNITTIDNISFIGGMCYGAYLNGMYLDARYVKVQGMEISDNGQALINTYSGIEIGADSISTIVTGNHIGQRAGVSGAQQKYGVKIDNGATAAIVSHNDLAGNATAPLVDGNAGDVTNSGSIISPNVGMCTPESFSVQAPLAGATLTMGLSSLNAATLILNPAALIATLTIILDPGAYDGQEIHVYSSQVITALTVTPGAGQTVSDQPTAMTAKGSFRMKYASTAANWYRSG